MSLTASDVSDAVLDGLSRLTSCIGERASLTVLLDWQQNASLLSEKQVEALLAFAISIAEVEVARTEELLANQQYEEDLQAERYAHQHQLDKETAILEANPVFGEPDFAERLRKWEQSVAAHQRQLDADMLKRGQDFVDEAQDRDFHDEEPDF